VIAKVKEIPQSTSDPGKRKSKIMFCEKFRYSYSPPVHPHPP